MARLTNTEKEIMVKERKLYFRYDMMHGIACPMYGKYRYDTNGSVVEIETTRETPYIILKTVVDGYGVTTQNVQVASEQHVLENYDIQKDELDVIKTESNIIDFYPVSDVKESVVEFVKIPEGKELTYHIEGEGTVTAEEGTYVQYDDGNFVGVPQQEMDMDGWFYESNLFSALMRGYRAEQALNHKEDKVVSDFEKAYVMTRSIEKEKMKFVWCRAFEQGIEVKGGNFKAIPQLSDVPMEVRGDPSVMFAYAGSCIRAGKPIDMKQVPVKEGELNAREVMLRFVENAKQAMLSTKYIPKSDMNVTTPFETLKNKTLVVTKELPQLV